MEINCFDRNAKGHEIVNLSKSIDRRETLDLHRDVNTMLCTFGICLNLLLVAIIIRSSTNMHKMRPILYFGLIVDLILATLNLISAPFTNVSFGRGLAITNGPFEFKSRFVNGLVMGFVGWIVLSSWICLLCQFIYRYHLVKNGERPRGKALLIFVVVVLLVFSSSLVMAIYFYTAPNYDRFVEDAINILEHDGLLVPAERIHGASVNDPRMQLYNLYFLILMISTYFILIFCALRIRKFLHNVAMSNMTKRLNADMDKVLIAFASTPILTSIVPSIWISYSVTVCKSYLVANLFTSWLIVLGPVLNPCMAIYFIRPYRRTLFGWVTRPLEITSSTKIFQNSSTSTRFFNVNNQQQRLQQQGSSN